MYSVVFESDKGKKYIFGKDGQTVFDMDLGNGTAVNIGTSQGFAQVGETVENQSVSGKPISVKGVVYGNIAERKRKMRNVFAPFVSGKLIFNDSYYIRVYVKSTPTFSVLKKDGRFTMQLFAPFPFFYSTEETSAFIGAILPQFRFPVNYAQMHRFGTKAAGRYTNIVNAGDVRVPFRAYIRSDGVSTNVTISNMNTFAFLKLNGTLNAGDYVNIYRDDLNVLRVELTSGGVTSDIIDWVDEESTLFELEEGDNLISANDDEGCANLTVKFMFHPAVGAVYET